MTTFYELVPIQEGDRGRYKVNVVTQLVGRFRFKINIGTLIISDGIENLGPRSIPKSLTDICGVCTNFAEEALSRDKVLGFERAVEYSDSNGKLEERVVFYRFDLSAIQMR